MDGPKPFRPFSEPTAALVGAMAPVGLVIALGG